ncbi:MAG: ARPP-1 family domain-containing protein [Armatimonadota bacterium]
MKTKHLWIASSVCLLLSGAVAWAMASTRRGPAEKRVIDYGPPPVIAYANRVRVEEPERHASLALFPVSVSSLKVPAVSLTLTQAVNRDLFEVMELKESEVNRLRVRNRAKEPVFIMAGEMLRGGKQDRIAGDDLIVPAKATLTIPVFCVEHGRWAGRESGFSVGHSLAGAGARKAARARDQGAVWSSVAEQQDALRAPSSTGALRSVHDSEAVRDQMKPYLRALSDLPDEHPKAVGVVAVVGDEIIAADLFSSRKLFETLWPDLLEAYVIDALERDEVRPTAHHRDEKRSALDEEDVLRWLKGLRSTGMSAKDTPGDGELYDLSDHDISGAALIYERGVVHIALFPDAVIAQPDYNALEFRRERVR